MIALIVGLHFLPLAGLFSARAYYFTGALLSLLALIAIVALLLGVQLVGPSPDNLVVLRQHGRGADPLADAALRLPLCGQADAATRITSRLISSFLLPC